MEHDIQLLDTVALTEDLPEHGLRRGQVGTAVEEVAPDTYEVEFVNNEGHTYALAPIPARSLLKLRHEPEPTA